MGRTPKRISAREHRILVLETCCKVASILNSRNCWRNRALALGLGVETPKPIRLAGPKLLILLVAGGGIEPPTLGL